jgi:N-dimethylarginine dimethylaminohydrolase
MKGRVIRTVAEAADLDLAALPDRAPSRRVLLCAPDAFEVKDVKNPFMEGNVGRVDPARARAQWDALRAAIERTGLEVAVLPAEPGLEDMVFAANQTLPGDDAAGRPVVVLSRMRHPSRAREVPFYRRFFEALGFRAVELESAGLFFEGMGDALWHPGKRLLWGGHGARSAAGAYEEVAAKLDAPVILLRLPHPRFYHLDTALSLLDGRSALVHPGAFDDEGRALLRRFLPRLIEAPAEDAEVRMAANAWCPDGRHVLIERGSVETCRRLRAAGFEPVELDTSEFMKSGGSVFCLKMAY